MNFNVRSQIIVGTLLALLLLVGVGGGLYIANASPAAPFAQVEDLFEQDDDFGEEDDIDDDDIDDEDDEMEEDDNFTGSFQVDITQFEGMTEAEAMEILQAQAEISDEEAQQIALDANPDAEVTEWELDVENGFLIYEVELSTGLEVVVDAGDGAILASELDD